MRFLLSENIQRIVGIKFSNLVHAIYAQDRGEVHTVLLENLVLELEEYVKHIDDLKKQPPCRIEVGGLFVHKVHPDLAATQIREKYKEFSNKYNAILGSMPVREYDAMVENYLYRHSEEEWHASFQDEVLAVSESDLWHVVDNATVLTKYTALKRLWDLYKRMRMVPYEHSSLYSRSDFLRDVRSLFERIYEYESGILDIEEDIPYIREVYRGQIFHTLDPLKPLNERAVAILEIYSSMGL